MSINQYQIEEVYSYKYFLTKVKSKTEELVPILEAMHSRLSKWLLDYKAGKWGKCYDSKSLRLDKIEARLDEIPTHLLHSVLILGETTLQGLATKVGTLIEDNLVLAAKSGAEIIAICDGLGYEIKRPILGSGESFMVIPKLTLDEELQSMLNLTLFLPPMLWTPNAWTNHHNGGYELVKESILLGDRFNTHEYPLNYTALNILQEVKYKLDPIICSEDDSLDLSSIHKAHRDQAKANFKQALKENRLVYSMYADKSFSFVYQYDKRGRVYAKGYHISPQGNEYRKAMLKFVKEIPLTDRGWYWLKVDIANAYGLDKLRFDERIKWIEENLDEILSNPFKFEEQANDPLLFRSAVNSYVKSLKTGKSDHIVRLDATCSGPQIMSVAMRDEKAFKMFNILGDEREDYYTLIAKKTYKKTKSSSIWGENPSWKDIRDQTKKATMTFWYNSTAKPAEFFGKDTPELQAYFDVLNSSTKGACKLKNLLNSCWDSTKEANIWTLPDNHTAYCPLRTTKKARIEIAEMRGGKAVMNFIATLKEPSNEDKRSLVANVVHSLDGWICRSLAVMLAEKGIELSPIHDSFGVHANHCDELRKCYRALLARLYREDIIDGIVSDLLNNPTKVLRGKLNLEIEKAIRDNDKGHYIC